MRTRFCLDICLLLSNSEMPSLLPRPCYRTGFLPTFKFHIGVLEIFLRKDQVEVLMIHTIRWENAHPITVVKPRFVLKNEAYEIWFREAKVIL